MPLCHHTFTSGCGRRSTNTVWHPTLPGAAIGPKPVCAHHYDPETFVLQGWFTDLSADIAFKECVFIDRKEEGIGYHSLIAAFAQDGSFMAGRELGQPMDPADQAVYCWNGYGWLVRFDTIVMLGDWLDVAKRYPKMLNGPKIHANKKTLASFF